MQQLHTVPRSRRNSACRLGVCVFAFDVRLLDKVGIDGAVDDALHRREQFGMHSEEDAQRVRERFSGG